MYFRFTWVGAVSSFHHRTLHACELTPIIIIQSGGGLMGSFPRIFSTSTMMHYTPNLYSEFVMYYVN